MTKKLKLQDRLVRFLIEEKGFQEVPSSSKKYRKLKGLSPEKYYFIGRNGAVRVGQVPSASISFTPQIHALMNDWEKRENSQG